MSSSLDRTAARIKAFVFDVDGVLTRGDLIYGPAGEWKVFNVRDGLGITLAREAGMKVALLSGRRSESLLARVRDLKIDRLMDGVTDKGPAFAKLVKEMGVDPVEVCYVGDDIIDLPAMRQAGFPVAVADAEPDVCAAAAWVTTRAGGCGAVREVIEFVLRRKGEWDGLVRTYQGE